MKKTWFTISNKSEAEAEISITDEIGLWGVSANDFADQLRAAGKITKLTVNLDSPGGDCNDGFTIYDAIKACNAAVTVNVIGLAASMASVIMLAADKGKIRISENGRVMIHRVTGGAHGNSDDLAAATQLVRQFEDRIVALYIARSGKTETDIRDMMKAQLGTWLFGQEAVDAGFADAVIAGAKARAFRPEWASLFTMLPAALFPQPDSVRTKAGTKAVDMLGHSSISKTNPMANAPETEPVTEPVAPVVTPPEPETPAPDIAAISAKTASDAVNAERARVTAIRAWAGDVAKVQNIDLSKVTDEFIASGKSLADFKEHVITNTFKAVAVATQTDTQGAQGNTIKREDFNKLSPFNQSDFCRKGGTVTD